MTDLHPDVEHATRSALERLEAAGATLVRLDMPEVAQASQLATVIVVSEVPRAIARFLDAERAGVTFEQLMEAAGEDIKAMPPIPEGMYAEALKARPAIQRWCVNALSITISSHLSTPRCSSRHRRLATPRR